MQIAVLGGGLTGLTAAYHLSGKEHDVTLLEGNESLGGLASGYKEPGWGWYLERTYHHIFSNDRDILSLAEEVGFGGFAFKEPVTAALYEVNPTNNYRTFSVDTPQDFLSFPLLSYPEKIRAGMVVAFLKLSPFLSLYEKRTAEKFLRTSMGDRVWEVLWEELFRKKFGKHAENILASFIWARIKKRTKSLGYPEGGFQEFINFVAEKNKARGVVIKTKTTIERVDKGGGGFLVEGAFFDVVISTLPTPIFLSVFGGELPAPYIKQLSEIKYLNAVNLILETDQPFFEKEYWVNMCDKKAPMMVLVQHTNFIDKKHYNNHHVLYCANYVEKEHPLWSMNGQGVLQYHLPYIQKITKNTQPIIKARVFRAPFAQPLFDREFPSRMPHFETPIKNLFIANLDMTYPYDRGTNYAVKLGKDVAGLV
ncbi:FAD-dependent oxidoreductase [Candidatus Roizmanbacteria bacterium]|nr:FAD-dependent oxidoreductase [Candidatus Roizmanbacteria bacterium]